MRSVSIFGATGSVGESAFDLLMRSGGPATWRTVALTGGRNVARLAEMARALRAEIAVIADEALLPDLREALEGSGVEAATGTTAIAEAADRPADWTLSAIVGAAGLAPGLRVVQRGGTLALANKESLVAAGRLLMGTAQRSGATILPVDSEHSAVFQCLENNSLDRVELVTLTASGGAFRDWPLERLARATVAEASSHPNWDMGQRITIDSASMFNKALEVIEAHEFFGLPEDRIAVLIHPESIVHALVAYIDGGTLAHLGPPDMRHAIGHALHWPRREKLPLPRLDLAALGSLTFRAPCGTRWPALALARQVIAQGGAAGAVLNAAKEQALDDFITGRIRFTDMAGAVAHALDLAAGRAGFGNSPDSLQTVLEWDAQARRDAAVWQAAA
ncbi:MULTISPECIES: 1-deoxy-D-xylulose-5-phosphate reductoisomerase [unclassified Paracoccus (in: a-proteobacteria)]|uniref:1-deoxy-D-xylulose-5-phosphate reductoisomerase n=1 Tax=unclassified Paracoccus (in: a-proteobacteria) TaxID=2688777 RepID=UPI001603F908|nr:MULTISPECIES: 1-deoxy-D-xylulose-5-phosphate reductoisomerase [unclassified Paracoccus (in: a-proteobacteria)]MBB1491404.1 1-deoxy-D-xylulose-5-phosphate reductoisomerase [Paracoccus sp. MC1854]MBB1499518.1 1-deoxy-D-xylulose-5-phosphate reductoisomerase [Paracoccus sp. MC1862]QQO46113.1 1-deoxy-D-xylulose-5-phosphate reductoisomerase [Paracoccus sp. MC1862]